MTSLGDHVFSLCYDLRSITIPSSVTSIGDSAFFYCHSLTSTYFLGDAPSSGSAMFAGVSASHKIYYLDTVAGFTSPTWQGQPTQMIDTSIYPATSWLLEFNHSYDTNLNQDLNGDGVSLLMAYGLDLNPNERLTDSLPKAELDSTTLSMKYYAGSAGVTYRVEASKDLNTWETAEVTVSDPDANGVLTASIDRDEVCGFLRLVVVEE